MIFIFLFGVLLSVVVAVLFNMDGEVIITVKSKHGIALGSKSAITKGYVAKRIKGKTGNEANHWVYYNDGGDIITDEALTKLIHKVFVDEDWYGEYNFYVNDEGYYSELTNINDVEKEQHVMNTVEEMEEAIQGTPV